MKNDNNLNLTNNYDDIIDLPHQVSKKHKRMDVMPFSALKGYDSLLSDTKKSNDDMINNEIEHEEIDSI